MVVLERSSRRGNNTNGSWPWKEENLSRTFRKTRAILGGGRLGEGKLQPGYAAKKSGKNRLRNFSIEGCEFAILLSQEGRGLSYSGPNRKPENMKRSNQP